jgi:hypothetical protein
MTAPQVAAWAIRYRYPGTVNGRPVGKVYVVDIGHRSWSYTYDIEEATTFATRAEAEAVARRHYWPEAKAVPA